MKRKIMLYIASTFCIFISHNSNAITFEVPIICPEEGYCYVQNYVDVNPVNGGQDYKNLLRSYDGHRGTDFRIPYLAMLRGVAVVAAANGKVLRVRNSMADRSLTELLGENEGYECGNGVVIDHGDGWHTQYCHMKKGSVTVKPGETVQAGMALGAVGLSGRTEFAHLHFQVTHNGKTVCPFSGDLQGETLAKHPKEKHLKPLWSDNGRAALQYVPPQLLKIDYTTEPPISSRDLLQRSETPDSIKADNKTLVFAAATALLEEGDKLVITLSTAEGAELAKKEVAIKYQTAQRFDYVGRTDSAKFVGNTLEGTVELWRNKTQLLLHKSWVKVK